MTQPIKAPAKTSNATARRNAIPIATHDTAVMLVALSAISGAPRQS
jgi:hypothetical protein